MTRTFSQFKEQLTSTQLEKLLAHFDSIYECKTLSNHEFKIAYLAYLWKNKKVILGDSGYDIPDAKALGIDLFSDYEITFEAGEDGEGGVNLGLLHDFYSFIELEKMV